MSTEVLVPVLGAEERSPVIVEWYKPDGAEVRLGEPVYRLETDFIAIDVEAEEDGVLRHWIEAGQSRPTGQAVAVIFRPGELEDEAAAESDLAESVPLEALAVDPELASEPEAIEDEEGIEPIPFAAFEALAVDPELAFDPEALADEEEIEPMPFAAFEALAVDPEFASDPEALADEEGPAPIPFAAFEALAADLEPAFDQEALDDEEGPAPLPFAAFEALAADLELVFEQEALADEEGPEPIPFAAFEALAADRERAAGPGPLMDGEAPEPIPFPVEQVVEPLAFPVPEHAPVDLLEFPGDEPGLDDDDVNDALDLAATVLDDEEGGEALVLTGPTDEETADGADAEPDSWASAMSSWAHSRTKLTGDEGEGVGASARPIPLLRRGVLPAAPPPEPGSAWASVPGDRQDFPRAWDRDAPNELHDDLRAALASAESAWEQIDPPVKDPSAPVTEELNEMAPLLMRERQDEEPFWMPDGRSSAGPVTLTLKVVVRMTEARKMREQLGREWRTAGVNPSDDDILIRALARASMEDDVLRARGDSIGLVLAEATEERVAILDGASRGPFRERVEALTLARVTEREGGCSATVTSFGHFGLDEGTPPLPEGHPFALGAGAIRVIFEAGDIPAPMMTLVLAYTPELIAVGRAARLLARVRELLEAPYALFAD